MRRVLIAALCAFAVAPALAEPAEGPDDGVPITSSSKAFADSYDAAIAKLSTSGFEANLVNPGLGAMPSSELATITKTIRAEKPIPGVSVGDPTASYDVILQPGHYGRKKGRTGASGAKISERALNAYLVGEIAKKLMNSGLKVLVVPADKVKGRLKAKIFLAIHADGSAKNCSAGPSLGYENNGDLFPMHAIGQGLAHAFGYDYADFRKDNYTVNESGYYMYKLVDASMLKGLLEVGEVTCAKSEDRLIRSSREITNNVAAALSYLARLEAAD